MAKKKKSNVKVVYRYRDKPKKKKKGGRRKIRAKKGVSGVVDMFNKNRGAVALGVFAAMASRMIFGAVTSEEAIDGSVAKREGMNMIAVPLAAVGPAVLISLLYKKAKPAHIMAAIVGGIGAVASDIVAPTVAQKLAEVAPDNPTVTAAAAGLLEPIDIQPSYPMPGDPEFIGPVQNQLVEFGGLPDEEISIPPALTFGMLPDAEIGMLPDDTIGIGDIYTYDE